MQPEPPTTIGTQWRWVHRLEHQVALLVYHIRLSTGKSSPKHIYQVLPLRSQCTDGSVGERLPPNLRMAVGLMGTHGERGIEQQHPLLRPTTQIARRGNGDIEIILYLLKDILQ